MNIISVGEMCTFLLRKWFLSASLNLVFLHCSILQNTISKVNTSLHLPVRLIIVLYFSFAVYLSESCDMWLITIFADSGYLLCVFLIILCLCEVQYNLCQTYPWMYSWLSCDSVRFNSTNIKQIHKCFVKLVNFVFHYILVVWLINT